ncbi:hypothetical protein Tco_0454489 [Tanacetum coccineum]
MVDVEKVDSEKTEEEKVDIEQAGDDKAKDDQVGALVFVIQNEKTEFPPSTPVFLCRLTMKNPAFLAQSSFTPAQPTFRAAKSLSGYELKKILFDKIDKSRSYMTHVKHQELYDALLNLIMLDEAIASGDVNPDKVIRKRDCHNDQDPTTSSSSKGKTQSKPSSTDKLVNAKEPPHEAEMDVEELILNDVVNDVDQPKDELDPKTNKSTWFMQLPRPPTLDPEWNQDKAADDGPEQTWFNDLVHAKKTPFTFDNLMSTPIDFTRSAMNRLKIDKLTKADLVGPIYKLLKGTYKSDRCSYDLSKPLPLQGSLSHLTIPLDFFFNNDLENLKTGNKERKYTTSITKTKRVSKQSKHNVYSTMKILSVVSLKVDKQFGYGYLKEIVVRRVDQKLYTFKEGDFPRLHLNDTKDMLLLHVQNKLFNLEGDEIVDLAVALHMFTRRIVI